MPGRFFRAISQDLCCSQYIASKSCIEHIGRRIFRVALQLLASVMLMRLTLLDTRRQVASCRFLPPACKVSRRLNCADRGDAPFEDIG